MTLLSMGPWLAGALTMLACFTAGLEMQARRPLPVPACASPPEGRPAHAQLSGADAAQDGASWQRWPQTTDF